MASIISAGTTSGTALNMAGDTSGQLQLATNGSTTAVTIDTSQNVGIGTTSPSTKLTIGTLSGNATNSGDLLINQTGTAIASNGGIELKADGAGNGYATRISTIFNGLSAYDMAFLRRNNSATWTESMRIDSSGNVLIGTTSAAYGNFTNALTSAALNISGNCVTWSQCLQVSAVNNSSVTAFTFRNAAGNVNGNGGVSGHFYVFVSGASGANSFAAVYTLNSCGNGTTDAALTIVGAAKTRGTNPVSSVGLVNDGVGGAVGLSITYINNSGVVTGGRSQVTFVGQITFTI